MFKLHKLEIIESFQMDKSDGLVLLGIIIGGSTGVSLVILLANGIIKNPFI